MRTPQYVLVTGLLLDFNHFSYFSHSMSLKFTAFITFYEFPLTITKVNRVIPLKHTLAQVVSVLLVYWAFSPFFSVKTK